DTLRGTTALMWAAANSNADAVRLLVKKGADVNAKSGTVGPGRKPYLAPPGRERIQEFIDGTGLRGAVVEQKGDPEAAQKFEREKAAAQKAIARFPETAGYNKRGEQKWGGLTPLIFAAREGDLASVKVLVEGGADVNKTSEY